MALSQYCRSFQKGGWEAVKTQIPDPDSYYPKFWRRVLSEKTEPNSEEQETLNLWFQHLFNNDGEKSLEDKSRLIKDQEQQKYVWDMLRALRQDLYLCATEIINGLLQDWSQLTKRHKQTLSNHWFPYIGTDLNPEFMDIWIDFLEWSVCEGAGSGDNVNINITQFTIIQRNVIYAFEVLARLIDPTAFTSHVAYIFKNNILEEYMPSYTGDLSTVQVYSLFLYLRKLRRRQKCNDSTASIKDALRTIPYEVFAGQAINQTTTDKSFNLNDSGLKYISMISKVPLFLDDENKWKFHICEGMCIGIPVLYKETTFIMYIIAGTSFQCDPLELMRQLRPQVFETCLQSYAILLHSNDFDNGKYVPILDPAGYLPLYPYLKFHEFSCLYSISLMADDSKNDSLKYRLEWAPYLHNVDMETLCEKSVKIDNKPSNFDFF